MHIRPRAWRICAVGGQRCWPRSTADGRPAALARHWPRSNSGDSGRSGRTAGVRPCDVRLKRLCRHLNSKAAILRTNLAHGSRFLERSSFIRRADQLSSKEFKKSLTRKLEQPSAQQAQKSSLGQCVASHGAELQNERKKRKKEKGKN